MGALRLVNKGERQGPGIAAEKASHAEAQAEAQAAYARAEAQAKVDTAQTPPLACRLSFPHP
jgi:hypothetical protein